MKEQRRWKLLRFSVQRWISGKSPFQARVSAGASLQAWKCSGRVWSERQGVDLAGSHVMKSSNALYCVGRGKLLEGVRKEMARTVKTIWQPVTGIWGKNNNTQGLNHISFQNNPSQCHCTPKGVLICIFLPSCIHLFIHSSRKIVFSIYLTCGIHPCIYVAPCTLKCLYLLISLTHCEVSRADVMVPTLYM